MPVNMLATRNIVIAFVCLVFSSITQADVLVLVHGWNANADSWVHSGVAQQLSRGGWQDAGVVVATPTGVRQAVAYPLGGGNRYFYRAHLPSNSSIVMQASYLVSQLAYIQQRHPHDIVHIAGHSSGGVVARMATLRLDYANIKTLITIASPHLGTPRAIQGLDIVNSKPFFCPGPGIDFMKSLFGGERYQYLKHSQGAMHDLTPAGSGNLIDWLNHQPHPKLRYHAIVHMGLDNLVPAISQDLNQVPVMRGRASTHVIMAKHELSPADGDLILRVLLSEHQ